MSPLQKSPNRNSGKSFLLRAACFLRMAHAVAGFGTLQEGLHQCQLIFEKLDFILSQAGLLAPLTLMACAEQARAGRVMDERTKRATQLCGAFMRLLDEEGFWLGDYRAFEKPCFFSSLMVVSASQLSASAKRLRLLRWGTWPRR